MPVARSGARVVTVFVVNASHDRDVGAAEDYGELHYVNHRYAFSDELDDERLPPEFVLNIQACVDDFDPATDFLLILGDHAQLVAMTAMLARRHKEFRVLRYDRKEQGYLVIRV